MRLRLFAFFAQPRPSLHSISASLSEHMTTDLKILIVGGGIAGLTLAALLEKAGIEYQVFERAAAIRPLGSVVAIGPNVLPVIEQLGLLEEFVAASKVTGFVTNFNEQRQQTSYFDYRELKER